MMKRIFSLLLVTFLIINDGFAQQFIQNFSGSNIGNSNSGGKYKVIKKNKEFLLEAGGEKISSQRPPIYFVSQEVEGDFIISANLQFKGKKATAGSRVGLMVRNSADEDASYVSGAVHGDEQAAVEIRKDKGGRILKIVSEITAPDFMQVERSGNEFIIRFATRGQPYIEAARVYLDLSTEVGAGVFIASANEEAKEKARVWNLRIEKPVPDDVRGFVKPKHSRLEILNVKYATRKVVLETKEHIEAPNWSRNGKYLVYNSDGRLYKFSLKRRKAKIIDTGFATAINNDHGISFDGKRLAISNHTEENGERNSVIYTLPIKGGEPVRVTQKGPSYWHGWSPDDKWHVYCALRDGNYDVYKIRDEGGEEIRLTTAEGLDDGPEYTPDGKYIYFNSQRTDTMEIWRMKPDGAEQEQVTRDEFQNWFPHPSPDGKWLIFLSYLPEVPAGSHPHNERVMLRMMPVGGGEINAVAFLYGGQGTINVPSWSPDSNNIAFVSYTY